MSFISAFYPTSDTRWQLYAISRGENERAALSVQRDAIDRPNSPRCGCNRTGKTRSRREWAEKLETRLENRARFWEYLEEKATLTAPEFRDTRRKERDRTCQRSLTRWSKRLTGSALGHRSFRSQATAGYAYTAVIA